MPASPLSPDPTTDRSPRSFAPTPPPSRLPLLLACGGSFLAFLDVTITNLAVPDLTADLGSDVATTSWIVTLYAVLFAALLVPAGRVADIVGRRRLYASGVALFTVASLLAVVAPSLGVLLVARAAQGIGAAALIPASLAFVLSDTAPERRTAAIGLWSASAALAAVIGPALGGVLVDLLGWRALFAINLPAGVLLLWATSRTRRDAPAGGRLPDPIGTLLLVAGIAAVLLAVTEGRTWGWTSPATLVAFVLGAVACLIVLARSRRHRSPVLPLDLWRNPVYRAANVASVLFGAALYASLLLGVLFLTTVWGYTELEAGLAMVPGAAVAAVVGMAAGRRGLPARTTAAVGSVLYAVPFAVSALWLPEGPHFLSWWLPLGTLMGVGIGGVSVGVSSAAALSVAPVRFAAATGLNLAARQVGGALGVATMAVIVNAHPPQALDGYRTVYVLCTVVMLAAGVAALRLRAATPATDSLASSTAPATAA